MDLIEQGLVAAPGRHWYYRAKARPLLAYAREFAGEAPLDVLDLGAGSGVFAQALMESLRGRLRHVWLVDSGYPSDSEAADSRLQGFLRRRRAPPPRFMSGLVLLMDVLEHLDDDAGFLKDAVSRCGPCRFFITAPAFPSLWSAHDEFLGHKRRYRLPALRALASNAGLRVTAAYYYFGLLLAPAWLWRACRRGGARRSDLREWPAALGLALEALCALEAPLRRWNRLGGLSCVVEARKS